jgi:hypothetical protein
VIRLGDGRVDVEVVDDVLWIVPVWKGERSVCVR